MERPSKFTASLVILYHSETLEIHSCPINLFFSSIHILFGGKLVIPWLDDLLLVTTLFFLFFTAGTTVIYYKRIKKVREKYEEAKDIVGDVVISLNKRLQRQESGLSSLASNVATLSLKIEKAVERLEDSNRRLESAAAEARAIDNMGKKLSTQVEELRKRMNGVILAQEDVMKKITEIEELKQKVVVSEPTIEAAIPIRKERALAPLTETELRVLEILATEGKKTAPEIEEKIELTREHTARLMKKLYSDGYLERDVQKMPYTYSVKEEMLRIMKRAEEKA